jgi:diguanylate cyclase (GGDEF)-like protein
VLGAHKIGLMDTSFDINDGSPTTFATSFAEGVATNLTFDEGTKTTRNDALFSAHCSIREISADVSHCGVSVAIGYNSSLNKHELANGFDLSKYDHVEIDATLDSPNQNDRVRLSLRNYNENYSTPNDFASLKLNSINYLPNKELPSKRIEFNSFRVDDSWIKKGNISFEDSKVDFSNVAFIEFVTDDLNEVGDYWLHINKISFHGQLFNELAILQIIILFWLIAIIFLVARQTKKLKVISNTDALTGLLNRRGITDWSYKKGTNLQNRRKGFLFYFDIDGFKKVNDTHGHSVGDELLCELGNIVKGILSGNPKMQNNIGLSRLAGDEFVLIISRINKDEANHFAALILEKLSSPIVISKRLIKVGLSMGISSFDPSFDEFEDILSRADSAMYCAKRDGKNRFRVFDDHVRDAIYRRKQIALNIRLAAENNEFSMVYMPIFRAADLYIHKVEVLLRCHSPALNGIGPDEFIPIAEEFGVIQNIDLMVIETTFKHMYRNKQVFENSNIKVCINISAKELNNVSFTSSLETLLADYRINPAQIEFEITETSLVEIDEQSIKILNQIRDMGISLALDDFGTGYTAFSHIVNYPIDCLKIDKSFIDDLTEKNEVKKTLVKSILAIASSFNLETVAEGIEKDEQFRILKELGCGSIQGYLLSKPISWMHFKALLEDQDGRGSIIKIAN